MGARLSANRPADEQYDPVPHTSHPVRDAMPERGMSLQRLLADCAFVLLLVMIVVLNVLVFIMETIQKAAEALILFTSYIIRYGLITPLDYCMHVLHSMGSEGVPVALFYPGRGARGSSSSWTPPTWGVLDPPTSGASPGVSMSCNSCKDSKYYRDVSPAASRSQPVLKPALKKSVCGSMCYFMDNGKCRETCLI